MKKNLFAALVLAAGVGVPSIANATVADYFGSYTGGIRIKFTNNEEANVYDTAAMIAAGTLDSNGNAVTAGGTFEFIGAGVLDALPLAHTGSNLQPGEDSWGIFRVDIMRNEDQSTTFYNIATAPTEITGLFYGATDVYLKVVNAGLPSETQFIEANGLKLVVYEDASLNFTPTAGPGGRTSASTYSTVTDGTLIWTANSVDGFRAGSSNEFFSDFQPQGDGPGLLSSAGGFLAQWGSVAGVGTGAYNYMFGDTIAEYNFTAEVGTFGWLANSDDPVRAKIVPTIPEPLTAATGMMALGALSLVATRRRKA